VLGIATGSGGDDGFGDRSSIGASRSAPRARSMSRQTRAIAVVSQPPRLSIAAASARLRRSHVSWIASSASLADPSMR
jgi:hypothetical protein